MCEGTKIFVEGECVNPPRECGNGVIDSPEECDDGRRRNGDGCSRRCTIEEGYSCEIVDSLSVCTLDPVCGNGLFEQRGS